MPDVEKPPHDPVQYLDKAREIMLGLADPDDPGGEVLVDHEDLATAISQATLWATMAQASALLQPDPSEVIALYQETVGEVVAEEVEKMARVRYILQTAARDGSRRHPAIHAALEVLGDG